MEKLSMCRVCLIKDVRLHCLVNTYLQEIYELLSGNLKWYNSWQCVSWFIVSQYAVSDTDTEALLSLETKDTRPLHACEMCCARLRNCLRLRTACLHSEEVFSHLLEDESWEVPPSQGMNMLQTTPIVHENVDPVVHIELNIHPSMTDEQLNEEHVGGLQDNVKDKEICTLFIKQENIKSEYVRPEDEELDYSIQNIKVEINSVSDNSSEHGTPESYVSKSNNSIPSVDRRDLRSKTVKNVSHQMDLNNFEKAATVTDHLKPTDLEFTSQCNNLNYSGNVEMLRPNIRKKYKQRVHTSSETQFSRNSNSFKHNHTHTRKCAFQCPTCYKCFSKRNHLTTHIRTHTGEKPFKCDACGKVFTTKSQLTNHTRTHTGEKPHKCGTCGKGFSTKSQLTDHIRTHTGEKPYKCDTCGKGFTTKSQLSCHTQRKFGKKPYKCDTCGKDFTVKSQLSYHTRTHTGEKPYKCDMCGKCLHRKGSLLQHIRTHTLVKSRSNVINVQKEIVKS